mmetsp:Transcript_27196/g.83491  ORF Transcript_27196/g.83491 Transcript_27196/m.83491 type:complete len:203 (-) Transcript_27196:392-1000(-)
MSRTALCCSSCTKLARLFRRFVGRSSLWSSSSSSSSERRDKEGGCWTTAASLSLARNAVRAAARRSARSSGDACGATVQEWPDISTTPTSSSRASKEARQVSSRYVKDASVDSTARLREYVSPNSVALLGGNRWPRRSISSTAASRTRVRVATRLAISSSRSRFASASKLTSRTSSRRDNAPRTRHLSTSNLHTSFGPRSTP